MVASYWLESHMGASSAWSSLAGSKGQCGLLLDGKHAQVEQKLLAYRSTIPSAAFYLMQGAMRQLQLKEIELIPCPEAVSKEASPVLTVEINRPCRVVGKDSWVVVGWCTLPAGLKPCSGGKGRWTFRTFLSYQTLLGIGLGVFSGVFLLKFPKWPLHGLP